MASLMGAKASAVVEEMVQGAMQPRQSMFATIAGLVILFFGATSLAFLFQISQLYTKNKSNLQNVNLDGTNDDAYLVLSSS